MASANRMRPAAAAAVAMAAIGIGPALSTVSAATAVPAPDRVIEHWDSEYGWVEVPAVPDTPPAEAWTRTVVLRTSLDLQWVGDVVVAADFTDDGVVFRRIDSATGRDAWTFIYPMGAVDGGLVVRTPTAGSAVDDTTALTGYVAG